MPPEVLLPRRFASFGHPRDIKNHREGRNGTPLVRRQPRRNTKTRNRLAASSCDEGAPTQKKMRLDGDGIASGNCAVKEVQLECIASSVRAADSAKVPMKIETRQNHSHHDNARIHQNPCDTRIDDLCVRHLSSPQVEAANDESVTQEMVIKNKVHSALKKCPDEYSVAAKTNQSHTDKELINDQERQKFDSKKHGRLLKDRVKIKSIGEPRDVESDILDQVEEYLAKSRAKRKSRECMDGVRKRARTLLESPPGGHYSSVKLLTGGTFQSMPADMAHGRRRGAGIKSEVWSKAVKLQDCDSSSNQVISGKGLAAREPSNDCRAANCSAQRCTPADKLLQYVDIRIPKCPSGEENSSLQRNRPSYVGVFAQAKIAVNGARCSDGRTVGQSSKCHVTSYQGSETVTIWSSSKFGSNHTTPDGSGVISEGLCAEDSPSSESSTEQSAYFNYSIDALLNRQYKTSLAERVINADAMFIEDVGHGAEPKSKSESGPNYATPDGSGGISEELCTEDSPSSVSSTEHSTHFDYSMDALLNHQYKTSLAERVINADAKLTEDVGHEAEQVVTYRDPHKWDIYSDPQSISSLLHMKCPFCPQLFTCYADIERHSVDKHHDTWLNIKTHFLRALVPHRPEGFGHPRMTFKCIFCSRLFATYPSLQGHLLERHYGDDPYECPFCAKRFRHLHSYSTHLDAHVASGNYPSYNCNVCSSSFSGQWELDLHSEIHDRLSPIINH